MYRGSCWKMVSVMYGINRLATRVNTSHPCSNIRRLACCSSIFPLLNAALLCHMLNELRVLEIRTRKFHHKCL